MEMLNRSIEIARDFKGMMEKIKDDAQLALDHEYSLSDRRPGENRAAHRARIKRERREGKVKA